MGWSGPQKIIKAIREYPRFLITSHVRLEGDALGSELALASLLRKLGKTVYIVNGDITPANYKFLPGVEEIYSAKTTRHKLFNRKFGASFVVDCSDMQRIGDIVRLIGREIPIINIDHHKSNTNFGKINWVDHRSSSTGEMVYNLFELLHIGLERKDALNIYTAIVTDTGSFRYSNTTAKTLYICSKLLKFGIKPVEVYAQVYHNNSVKDMSYVREIVSRISFAKNNKIAWVKIDRAISKTIRGKREILDIILDFIKSIDTVKMVVVFSQEERDRTRLSFRSKSPFDVQKIASVFGGGGHKFASGCVIQASFKEAQRLVLKEAIRMLSSRG